MKSDDRGSSPPKISPPSLDPAEVRRLLSASTEPDVAEVVVEAVADRFPAASCFLARTGDAGFSMMTADAQADPPSLGGLPLGQDLLNQSFRSRQSCVIHDRTAVRSASADPSNARTDEGCRSLILVPLADLGVVVLVKDPANAFTEADLGTVEHLVSVGESALDNLAEDQDVMEEVADILAHDIQSPLQVAQGRLEMAKTTSNPEHLEKIGQAHQRIRELLEGVVKLIRTGDRVRSTEPVILEDAVAKVRSALEMPDTELIVDESVIIDADENALLEILENLFRNAHDHAGPQVTVRIGPLTDGFYVEDDGPGIPADRRETVFGMGYSSSTNHSGLGLNIVQRLADAHGWDIRVTHGRDGGARFEITGVDRFE